jgi:predicted CoA-binding protein
MPGLRQPLRRTAAFCNRTPQQRMAFREAGTLRAAEEDGLSSSRDLIIEDTRKGVRMSKIDPLVKDFLAQKKIAVIGVSDRRETGCNAAYQRFKDAGYQVYAVNPRITTFKGDACYPDLKSLPEKPDGVFILANPQVTEQVVRQCVDLGVKHVWMHCMMGVKPGLAASMTSVSTEAVRICQENGISVIPGSCPNQFLNPDFGHKMMRGMWGLFGFMNVPD